MTPQEALGKLLPSFRIYYDVKTEDITAPFDAEAVFFTHDEAYFLMKSAKLAQSESKEFIFFKAMEHLDTDSLMQMDETAWTTGMSRVEMTPLHYSTDVSMVLIADTIDADTAKAIKKLRHYKSYCMTLRGFSRYRLIALELSTGKIIHNHLGGELKKLIRNIQK